MATGSPVVAPRHPFVRSPSPNGGLAARAVDRQRGRMQTRRVGGVAAVFLGIAAVRPFVLLACEDSSTGNGGTPTSPTTTATGTNTTPVPTTPIPSGDASVPTDAEPGDAAIPEHRAPVPGLAPRSLLSAWWRLEDGRILRAPSADSGEGQRAVAAPRSRTQRSRATTVSARRSTCGGRPRSRCSSTLISWGRSRRSESRLPLGP